MLATEAAGGVMALEAARTSAPVLDAAMILRDGCSGRHWSGAARSRQVLRGSPLGRSHGRPFVTRAGRKPWSPWPSGRTP